jgi:TolA-binding protein
VIRQIAVGTVLFAMIAAVSVEAAQVTPPGPPTKVPGPFTLDQAQSEISDLQARAANDERQIAQLQTELTQLEAQVGGRNFTALQIQVRQLQTQLQQLRADFDKHTHTVQEPKFGTLANVGSVVNNAGGFFNYVVPLFSPDQMKAGAPDSARFSTYTTSPPKY